MGMFVVFNKLNQKDAQVIYDGIKKWFEANPKRKTCHTEIFKVRRSHIKEDILDHSEDGVELTD